jgi:2-polyprenyl-6-methoxyphenol hydroxylase-like FAD-dependent oxidoreductase
MRKGQTEVLVVGAGPVGLWTALLLAEAGLDVTIIDREERTTARTYACALHPRTLRLLQRVSLEGAVLERGRRIQKIAFYDGAARRAELDLSKPGGPFPFLLILPQHAVESLLEQRLAQAGVRVLWNHRFDALAEDADGVTATIEELAGTSTGYIVPHWETIVKNRAPLHARLVIGADGHNSLVRQRAGLEYQRVGELESFAAYEFESSDPVEAEVRVVLDEATTNVLWPLPEKKFRWTFQMVRSDAPADFPEKERRAVRFEQANVDERIRQYVQQVSHQRAPWFSASVSRIAWCSEVAFERRLAKPFGRSRCWLAGDAAHQTGPVGVQSMNRGFEEGAALAEAIRKILREAAPLTSLDAYNQQQQTEWQRLLGLTGGLQAGRDTVPWVKDRRARILPCLPASGADLVELAGQLGLNMAQK